VSLAPNPIGRRGGSVSITEEAAALASWADLALVDQRVLDGRILLVEYAPTWRPIPR